MQMTGLGVLAVMVCAFAAGDSAVAADSQRNGDHRAAHAARVQGRNLPLREIERRVIPRVRGARYLGFDFDAETTVYTLKFLRDGNVIWVEVDGRSGQILGKTGN